MKARLRLLLVALMLMPGLVSCRLLRKPRPVPPPFNPPQQSQPVAAQAPPPFEWPPAPQIPISESLEPNLIPEAEAQILPPPPTPRPTPSSPPAQQTQTQPQSPPVAISTPQLRPMLGPAQTQELERTIAERIGRAQGILRSLEDKRLSRQQRGALSQIWTFLRQAEEARSTDLQRAGNLAERAEVLATDLASQVR